MEKLTRRGFLVGTGAAALGACAEIPKKFISAESLSTLQLFKAARMRMLHYFEISSRYAVDTETTEKLGLQVVRIIQFYKGTIETAIDALERNQNVARAVAKATTALKEFAALEDDPNSILNRFLRVANGAVVASR